MGESSSADRMFAPIPSPHHSARHQQSGLTMADILGTTVGVVSVGIQLCDKISVYVQDFKTRDDQLGRVLRGAQHLKHLLQLVDRLAQDSATKQPEASYTLSTQVSACEKELEALRAFTYELAPSLSQPDDRRGKMREAAKRFTFPFNRADLVNLETRLEKACQALSLAVDCYQLHVQSSMQSDLNRLSIRLEEMHRTMQSWGGMSAQQRGQQVMALALTTPSTLKEVCDVVSEGSGSLSEDAIHKHGYRRPLRTCDCRPRRYKYSHGSPLWLSFSFLEEIVEDKAHRSSCPRSRSKPTETSRSMALTYNGLRGYLSMAVSIGFLTTHGAGGCSISPMLQCRRTVQRMKTGAFVLIDRMARCFSFCPSYEVRVQVIDQGLEILRQLYDTQQALPTDIDEEGATLLTRFCHDILCYTLFTPDVLSRALREMELLGGKKPEGTQSAVTPLLWRVIDSLFGLGIPTQGVGSGWAAT